MSLSLSLYFCVCVRVVSCSFGDLLSFTLTAFVELMDHGIVSWDTFSVAFIKKVGQELSGAVLSKLKMKTNTFRFRFFANLYIGFVK